MSLATRVNDLATRIGTEIKSVRTLANTKVTGVSITSVERMTQAQYDSLATKSTTTLYVIVG